MLLQQIFQNHKTVHITSIDDTTHSDDLDNITTENPIIDDEEQDLIHCDNYHSHPSSESPPTMGHTCSSIAPNLVSDNTVSLEESLLHSSTNEDPSE